MKWSTCSVTEGSLIQQERVLLSVPKSPSAPGELEDGSIDVTDSVQRRIARCH